MTAQTVVLVTGANRGIGRGFVEAYLARPSHFVIAAVRDPTHPTSESLQTVPKASNTTLLTVQLDATNPDHPKKVVAELAKTSIDHVDILIANAGISQAWPKVSEVDTAEMQRHLVPNVYGVVWLYQAFLPLLNKSKEPKWVSIGSSAAMLTEMAARPMPNAAYGPTKVVLHWLTAKMHFEEPKLVALPMDPGWVQTDLGNFGAVALGYEKAETPTEDSVGGMMKIIDVATKETHSGKLWVWDGRQAPW